MENNKHKKKLPPYQLPEYLADTKVLNQKLKENTLIQIVYEQVDECSDCQGAGWVKTESKLTGGKLVDGQLIECPNEVHFEERMRKLEKKLAGTGLSKIDFNLKFGDMKPHVSKNQATFNDYNGPVILPESNIQMLKAYGYLTKNPIQHRLIYILGGYGCGKTHFGKCLVSKMSKIMSAKYVTLWALMQYIKNGYQSGESDNRFETISVVKFLVIDEFDFSEGKFKASDDNIGWLHRLLTRRIELSEVATTVLIGNEPIENGGFGNINSRVKEFKRIYNLAPDMRCVKAGYNLIEI